jgi:hypothetical protein
MELKSYQQRVIADLTDYLGYLEECKKGAGVRIATLQLEPKSF